MGYIVLNGQLKTIAALSNRDDLSSIELLWLPGRIKLTVWPISLPAKIYEIQENGYYKELESSYGIREASNGISND